jgi:hypothetical protein
MLLKEKNPCQFVNALHILQCVIHFKDMNTDRDTDMGRDTNRDR